MRHIAIIVSMLVVAMLAFGCTYSTQSSVNYSTNGSANMPAYNGTQGPATPAGEGGPQSSGTPTGGSQPSGSSGGTPATPPAETGTTSGTGTASSSELSGANYSSLLGAGTSSECTLTYSEEPGGPVKTLQLFFDGNWNMRMEQATAYPDCPLAATVYKGDSSGNGMLYLTCPDHAGEALGEDFMSDTPCDWQSMTIEEQYGSIGGASLGIGNGYMTPPLAYVTDPAYSCRQWTLDSTKFDTAGFVCD